MASGKKRVTTYSAPLPFGITRENAPSSAPGRRKSTVPCSRETRTRIRTSRSPVWASQWSAPAGWTARANAGAQRGSCRGSATSSRTASAGTSLPASRVLARELGVARGIVVDAYEQLAAEGYLEARQGSGTRVRGTRPARAVAAETERERAAARNSRLLGGLPDPLRFPRSQWLRRYRAALDALPDTSPGYPDPGGAIELRTALAAYLGRVRAVVTSPDELVVCGGFTQGAVLVGRGPRAG